MRGGPTEVAFMPDVKKKKRYSLPDWYDKQC